jgi:hypothetical protein
VFRFFFCSTMFKQIDRSRRSETFFRNVLPYWAPGFGFNCAPPDGFE